jgi:hypothetical protein
MMRTGYVGKGLGQPVRPTTKTVGLPAPAQGINAVDPLAGMPPSFCLAATNLIAAGRTMDVRPGYQAFATSVGSGNGVRTIMPFADAQTANNKLFAAGDDGIYDITAGGAIGASAIALSAGATTGYGVWTNFVLDNGAHYLFYADPTDGLFEYTVAGGWVATTGITGVSETLLSFCMQFKGRMWFAERNSARGWYLAAGAVAGAATRFDFGNKFNHGGTLVGLYSWTVDGGEGVDDHLVAISSEGDVMVYKGDDPSSVATWALVGQYYVGALPAGRRVAQAQGGDLYILSQYGVIPLTRLMQGALVQQEDTQLTRNIAPLIADTMFDTRQSLGWEMRNVPGSNCFVVSTPKVASDPYLQFCLSTRTMGWTTWENLPYLTGDVYQGEFYFGDDADTVYRLTGGQDDVDTAGANGTDIPWFLLTSYQEFGEPGLFHRAQFIRLVFTAASVPGVEVSARYDYDLSSIDSSTPAGGLSSAEWDVALWDQAIWGSSLATYTRTFGASGIGRAIALAIAGNSNAETGLVRMDLMFDSGGPL